MSGYVFLSFIGIAVSPVLPELLGLPYVPTPSWIAWSGSAAIVVGILAAVYFLWLITLGAARNRFQRLGAKAVLLTFAAPFVGFWLGYRVVVLGAPMLVALAIGGDIEHTFTVESTESAFRCSNSITVAELPLLANRFCGLAKELAGSLAPGSRVSITGRGWRWGVFASDVRRID
ncbi:hypothetical protein ACIQUG_06095 [Ensifer sp. NPDC090286]|uniref:hypothetical protein n=1 Tax=unclassified Ensifer TaxID=2633371 RepID=UPI0019649C43|nr:hypothetical protein [Ensifer sp. PDNC004]QRY68546.1 hypothetical protein JVX98_09810 [Ensifer sp. PDNC004]